MKDYLLGAFLGLLVLIALELLLGGEAEASEWDVDVLITYQHTSDLFQLPPEPTQDYLGFGWTFVSPSKKWEFDLTTGIKAIDCTIGFGSYSYDCEPQSGSEVSVRWYPWRKR